MSWLPVLVFSTVSVCAGQPTASLPRFSWEESEINVTEGSVEITCFTSDSGSSDPYQVNVNSRGKGSNPARRGKKIIIMTVNKLTNNYFRRNMSTNIRSVIIQCTYTVSVLKTYM